MSIVYRFDFRYDRIDKYDNYKKMYCYHGRCSFAGITSSMSYDECVKRIVEFEKEREA